MKIKLFNFHILGNNFTVSIKSHAKFRLISVCITCGCMNFMLSICLPIRREFKARNLPFIYDLLTSYKKSIPAGKESQ